MPFSNPSSFLRALLFAGLACALVCAPACETVPAEADATDTTTTAPGPSGSDVVTSSQTDTVTTTTTDTSGPTADPCAETCATLQSVCKLGVSQAAGTCSGDCATACRAVSAFPHDCVTAAVNSCDHQTMNGCLDGLGVQTCDTDSTGVGADATCRSACENMVGCSVGVTGGDSFCDSDCEDACGDDSDFPIACVAAQNSCSVDGFSACFGNSNSNYEACDLSQ